MPATRHRHLHRRPQRRGLAADRGRDRVLFSNAATGRGGSGRPSVSATLHAGPGRRAAYCTRSLGHSDLAVAPDPAIGRLDERGAAKPYETLTLARFDLEWLTDGVDRL